MEEKQKYNFAVCLVLTISGIKKVTIALSKKINDDRIFYYCNNYEDFLELLIKEPILNDCNDFLIKAVLSLKNKLE